MNKTKVVIFTTNNARILTNPRETNVFRKRPNCYVNPNLDFVGDCPPQYWKAIKSNSIPIDDSKRVSNRIDELAQKYRGEEITREQVFYYTLKKHFDRALIDSSEACYKISELLELANGVNRKDIANKLRKDLIINYNDESLLPENEYYEAMISQFENALIIEMDQEEKEVRSLQINKYGADNWINVYKEKFYKRYWPHMFIISASIGAIAYWLMK